MKPQFEPVCGHLPLPNENKATGSGIDMLFLESPISFMGTASLHTKCNEVEISKPSL